MMIKRILSFLVISLLVLLFSMTAIYYLNPHQVQTDNVRPRIFGIDIYRIPSKSMLPLLTPSDYILVSNTSYKEEKPQKGDVIVFYRPKSANLPFIKRVIATEGDSISLQNGQLFINKKAIEENYINSDNNRTDYSLTLKKQVVPENHFFVLGDNRDNSADSRQFGSVSEDAIIGKATSILYGKNNRSGTEIK